MPGRRRPATAAAAAPAEMTPTPAAPAASEPSAEEAAKAAEEKKKAAELKAEQAQARQAERERQEAHQLEQLLTRFGEHPAVPGGTEGDESLSAVAASLNITSGKAAFILMKDAVAKNKVPSIVGETDEELLKAIRAARDEAGTYSSWGWLAARSGQAESWIKSGLAELKLYEPKAENIASKRAALKPQPEPAAATDGAAAGVPTETTTTGRRRRKPVAAGNAS